MKKTNIKKVVIVGGGSAGWMTAAALIKVMGSNYCQVTLVESDAISTVSVGEATIPYIIDFNNMLGINENDFIKKTQATFKLGIDFINWNNEESYTHPFSKIGEDINQIPFHHYWLKMNALNQAKPLDEYCLASVAAKRNKFAQPFVSGNPMLKSLTYAYHFDATLYAQYLRDFAIERGVNRIEGKVINVSTNKNNGYIESLSLENGKTIEGDLFIDCTGFKALLMEGVLNTGFEDWSEYLPCDTAVAMPCMPKDPNTLEPYTKSTAQKSGWTWRIPLQSRIGNGYVYPSKYVTDEEAVTLLKEQMEGEPIGKPNFLRWTTGMRKKGWNKNCIAIGLSAGFVEPLESTGLHLIQRGIVRLLGLFPQQGIDQIDVDTFNEQAKSELEYIRDFIILHYKATDRNDSEFWQYCQSMAIPERLQKKIDLYLANGRIYKAGDETFSELSWLSVMHGQGLKPKGYHPLVDALSEEKIKELLDKIHYAYDKTANMMPTQIDYINQYCKAESGKTKE